MAELIRVRFKSGTEATVGAEYVERWPEDIAEVLDSAEPAPIPEASPVPTPVQESKVATKKEKK